MLYGRCHKGEIFVMITYCKADKNVIELVIMPKFGNS